MVSAFSIGKAQRNTYPVNDTPGPGAYQPVKKQKQNSPSYKIGNGSRSGLLKSFAPGPGAYNPPEKMTREGSKYTFGIKKPSQTQQLFVPGPGAYNPNYRAAIKALPNYSLAGKYNQQNPKMQPGPGTYEYKSTVQDVPSNKFGQSQRLGFYQDSTTPGPGTYVKRPSSAGPQYRFGQEQRGTFDLKKNPGPGEYESMSDFKQSKKGFSMISRKQNQTNESYYTPGPGSYCWEKQQKARPPSYKIGQEMRGQLSKEALRTPGPGEYESRYEFARPKSAQVRIGSSTRRPLYDSAGGPGPGTYDQGTTIGNGPKHQMLGTKYDPIQSQFNPGPGAYNPNESLSKQRPQSAKIGSGQRSDFAGGHKEAPGPGNYNIRGQGDGPRWGFGTSMRPALNQVDQSVPGPGNYQLKPTFADVPSYLLPNKF